MFKTRVKNESCLKYKDSCGKELGGEMKAVNGNQTTSKCHSKTSKGPSRLEEFL